MVASRQLEDPFYRGIRRICGRGFGALAQVFGTTLFPVLGQLVVPAAKLVGAEELEFGAPKIAEVVSDRRNFKSATKVVGRQILKK